MQVIIDNSANYVSSDSMLIKMHPTLLWNPCVSHCIALILEDMQNNYYMKDVIELIKSIRKFIYNDTLVHSLIRKFTGKRELVHPTMLKFIENRDLVCLGIICFSTNFVFLQCLVFYVRSEDDVYFIYEWYASMFSKK